MDPLNEAIRSSRLPNGLTVLTDKMEGVRSATLGFFFRIGARNEPAELNGITHFIEHCVFKGSASRSALEIAAEQDRLGGNLDAFTTHEETGFVIKVVDDQFDRAFDLLADLTGRPLFDKTDLANERRVIVEEIKMNEDSPEEVLSDIFQREFFPGSSLGLTITGTPASVSSFTDTVAARYHRQAFSAANLIIAAAGNVDHDHLIELANRSPFGTSTNDRNGAAGEPDVPSTAAPVIVENRADLEQAHLLIATPFVGGRDRRRYAADLLANILGGGTSSRLWQKVREERGLAYSVGSSAIMFRDCGMFMVSAGTSPEQTMDVADITVKELRSIVLDGVTEDELDLAKQQTRASVLLSLEDSAIRATSLAQAEMLHGRQIPVRESLANVAAVTPADIKALAEEFFRTEHLAFAALGDLDGLEVTRKDLAI